jgi:hypothetical protein
MIHFNIILPNALFFHFPLPSVRITKNVSQLVNVLHHVLSCYWPDDFSQSPWHKNNALSCAQRSFSDAAQQLAAVVL